MAIRFAFAPLLLAISFPALAQTAPAAGEPVITPRNGQSSHQQWTDRYECYGWAKTQSGFDPVQSSGNPPGRDLYRRAFTACMDGRGYSVTYAAPPPAPPPPSIAPPPPPRPIIVARPYAPVMPELIYRPFHFQIEGGYTVAAGNTSDYLDDGGNVGFGVGWFPSASFPVGLRVDGSYSRFDARNALLVDNGDGFAHGHEDIYGGDVDLQFNLAHRASNFQFYLLGGAGWYRERTTLRQVSFESGQGCGFYNCGPALTEEERNTSPWRSAWNAGIGGEIALPGGGSFFVEARYLRIAPHDSDMQFVPIRVGLRF